MITDKFDFDELIGKLREKREESKKNTHPMDENYSLGITCGLEIATAMIEESLAEYRQLHNATNGQRPTCETCSYWDRDENISFEGECRRYAPASASEDVSAIWRDTRRDYWCGDHPDFETWAE